MTYQVPIRARRISDRLRLLRKAMQIIGRIDLNPLNRLLPDEVITAKTKLVARNWNNLAKCSCRLCGNQRKWNAWKSIQESRAKIGDDC